MSQCQRAAQDVELDVNPVGRPQGTAEWKWDPQRPRRFERFGDGTDQTNLNGGQAAATKPFGFVPFYTGAGAGGHCIPKDPRFLLESSKKLGLEFNSIAKALEINSFMPRYIAQSVDKILTEQNLKKSLIVCGLSYKPNMEDMRDSPGFKIVNEFSKLAYDVAVYDPFFKNELLDKYLYENNLEKADFHVLTDLDNSALDNISCICIVQHHTQIQLRLDEIYKKSLVPVLYDCQSKMIKDPKSKTILKSLGS